MREQVFLKLKEVAIVGLQHTSKEKIRVGEHQMEKVGAHGVVELQKVGAIQHRNLLLMVQVQMSLKLRGKTRVNLFPKQTLTILLKPQVQI